MALNIFAYLLLFIFVCRFAFANVFFIFLITWFISIWGELYCSFSVSGNSLSYLGTWLLQRPSLQTMREI